MCRVYVINYLRMLGTVLEMFTSFNHRCSATRVPKDLDLMDA